MNPENVITPLQPTMYSESEVQRILSAYRDIFPEITPALAEYWDYDRTRSGHELLRPYLTSNFHTDKYRQFHELTEKAKVIEREVTDVGMRGEALIAASEKVGVGFSLGICPWTDHGLHKTYGPEKTKVAIVLGHDWYPLASKDRNDEDHPTDMPLWAQGLHDTHKYHYAVPQAILGSETVLLFLNLVPDYRLPGAKPTGKLTGYAQWSKGFDAVLKAAICRFQEVSIISWGAHAWEALWPQIQCSGKPPGIMRHARESQGRVLQYQSATCSIPYLPTAHPCDARNFNEPSHRVHARNGFLALGLGHVGGTAMKVAGREHDAMTD